MISQFLAIQIPAPALLSATLLAFGLSLIAQDVAIDSIEDKALLNVMIEDTTSELARNEASLVEVRSVLNGLGTGSTRDEELRLAISEHVEYYDEVITSQKEYLGQLYDQLGELEKRERDTLRNLKNFGSPYQSERRTAFLDLILKPRTSTARFGDTGKTQMEDLDAELFAAIGGLQNRLNQETQNRQEANYILLDREGTVNTIVEMQKVSQGYFDERFVLYDKMNQTYEQILRWRPDLAIFFRPPPQPKPPEVYKRALERMQKEE